MYDISTRRKQQNKFGTDLKTESKETTHASFILIYQTAQHKMTQEFSNEKEK